MKKLFATLALPLACVASAAPNLFVNPGFEEAQENGRAKGWACQYQVVPTGITGNALQAKCNMQVSGNPNMNRSYTQQNFKKLAAGDYMISGYICGDKVKALWVGTTSPVAGAGKMHWINANKLEDDGVKEGWRRFEFTLELKQEADISFVIEVMAEPNSTCLLDDFSMVKL